MSIGWVCIAAYAVAGIGLDLLYGVNPLYLVYDQFYKLTGEFVYSTERGVVQTFVDIGGENGIGSSREVGHVSSGANPTPGADPADVERVFPIVRAGWELYFVLTSAFVLAVRLVERR